MAGGVLQGISPTISFNNPLQSTEWGEITGTLSEQTDLQNALDGKQAVLPTTTLEVTNFAADAWITIATAPLASLVYEKDLILDVTAVTPLGTCTDTCLVINYAYNPSNFASMQPQLTAFTSHSFNSTTTAENGLVLYQSRVGIIGTNLVIQVRKYKNNSLTIYTTPRHTTPYVMRSGTATAADSTPTSSTTITLSAGVTGYNIIAASAGLAGYSQVGTYAGYSLTNTTNKTNQWAYVGNIYIAYNATYRYGWSWNYDYILKEINNSEADSSYATYDTVRIQLRGNLAAVADTTAFNAGVPSFDVSLVGNTKLAASDVCCLVYSTSTSVKYIYLYVKLKTPNTHYYLVPTSSYQGSYGSTNNITTGYCYFNVANNQTPVASLPTPAQGSVVYATKINYDDLSGLVPYTGATSTLNLGSQDLLTSGYINGLLMGEQTSGFTVEGGQSVNAKFSCTLSTTLNGGTHSGTNTGDQDLSGYTNAAFKTISVSGQSDVVAESKDDTLNLVAGSNITITTDASTDSVTISAAGGGVSDGDKGDVTVSSSGTVWTVNKTIITSKSETSSAIDDFVLFSDTSNSGSLQKCKPRNLKVVDGAATGDIPYVNSGVLGGGAPISTDGFNYVWLGDRYSTGISNATEFSIEGYQVLKGYARAWKEVGCWLFPKEGVSSFADSSNGGFDAPEVGYGFGGVSGNPYYKMLYDSELELEQQTKIPFEIKIPDDYDVNSQCYWHIHFSLEPDANETHTGLVAFNIEYTYASEQPDCYSVCFFSTTDVKIFSCPDVASDTSSFPHLVTVHDDQVDLVTFNYGRNEIIRGFVSLHGNTKYDGYVIPLKVEIDYRAGDLGQYKHREN